MEKIYSGKVKLTLLIIMLLVGFGLFIVRSMYVSQKENQIGSEISYTKNNQAQHFQAVAAK
jgi:hypothetical protein